MSSHRTHSRSAAHSPRGPLVFDLRALPRRPGSMRQEQRTVPAPAGLGTPLASVPADAAISLALQLESVTEGVLVTVTATAPVAAECARCLEPFQQMTDVRFQELFSYQSVSYPPAEDGEDGYALHGDLLDLEPALRDALVLALPLAPLCRPDCPGLCPDCGVPLAEAGSDHSHEHIDPRWAALRGVVTRNGPDGPTRSASS